VPYQTGIREVLLDWGLIVHEIAGWRTTGSSSFDPHGHVCHHDVINDQPGTSDHMPGIIRDGRPDLAGPLANFWLETDGDVHLCAAGTANHAGAGFWHDLNENRDVWGTEANNNGSAPWPDEQLEAWYRLCAATCEFSGFAPSEVCGHKEWATPPGRKPDPHTLDMNQFRRNVANATKGGFLMGADADRVVGAQNRTTSAIVNQGKKDRANATRLAALARAQAARLANDAAGETQAKADVKAADKVLAGPDVDDD
jgi:hypothetical protein